MGKPRIIYVIEAYPAITETYIQSEIDALSNDFEISVIAEHPAKYPNHDHHPSFQILPRAGMLEAIREFRPQVIHTHWLVQVPLVERLARQTGVPFTVRAHSFDAIWNAAETPSLINQVAPMLNGPVCLGVLGFPFMRANFVSAGVRDDKLFDSYPAVNVQRFFDRSPNGNAIMTGGAARAPKQMEDFIRLASMRPGPEYNVYAIGHRVEQLKQLNSQLGNPVKINEPVQPSLMPREYKRHSWLVLTASSQPNSRGWPVMIAEAQASGVGVCMRNIRSDLSEYVGEAGFLYDEIEEVAEIISRPFPEERRQLGFEQSRKSDIRNHRKVLVELWHGAKQPQNKPRRRSAGIPAVTVILPTFNRAATLGRAIDSVLGQTFTDFELIVVDDGSRDRTADVLKAFRNHDQIQIVSQAHAGCAVARNRGLALARGQYVAFQDSDDEWLPGKLEKAVNALEGGPAELGVFYSDMWRIRKDQSGIYWKSPDVQRGVLIDERTLDYQVFCIGIVSALIKRECLAQVGVFDESLIRYSDLDLLIRLSDRYDFLHCREPLVKYYESDGLSANHRALVLARQYLIEKYRDRLAQSNHLKDQQLLLKRAKQEARRARFSPIRSALSTAVRRAKHGAAALRYHLVSQKPA